MFEKVGHIAEQTAMASSRRQFLGRLGRAALAAAGAVAGVLALPDIAQAKTGVCGPQSVLPCRGAPFYSPCRAGQFRGRCRPYNGTCLCQ